MRWRVVVALVALVACKEPSKREDAPRAAPSPARLLRYQPAHALRYQLAVELTSPSALVPIDVSRTFAIEIAGDERHLRPQLRESVPLTEDDLAEATRAAVLIFPELPEEPVHVGDQWTVPLNLRVRDNEQQLRLSHVVRYAGELACPGQVGSCAQLVVEAPAQTASVRIENTTWLLVYSLSGTVALDVARGVVVDSRLDVTANVAKGAANVPVNAKLVAKPVD
jgi:hypothetical protein